MLVMSKVFSRQCKICSSSSKNQEPFNYKRNLGILLGKNKNRNLKRLALVAPFKVKSCEFGFSFENLHFGWKTVEIQKSGVHFTLGIRYTLWGAIMDLLLTRSHVAFFATHRFDLPAVLSGATSEGTRGMAFFDCLGTRVTDHRKRTI